MQGILEYVAHAAPRQPTDNGWLRWAVENRVDPVVIAFVRCRPGNLDSLWEASESVRKEYGDYIAPYSDLPKARDVLDDPTNSPVPNDCPALTFYLLIGKLAMAIRDIPAGDPDLDAYVRYASRLPLEYATEAMSLGAKVNRDLLACREASLWIKHHKERILD